MSTIGDNIRAARKRAGLSQLQLAQNAGITKAAISRYESGLREPRLEHLKSISEVFGVTTDELMGIPPLPHKAIPMFDNDPTLVEMPGIYQEYTAFNSYLDGLGYHAVIELSPDNPSCLWTLYDSRNGVKYMVPAETMNRLMETVNAFTKFQITSILDDKASNYVE